MKIKLHKLAKTTPALREETEQFGLSLGGRACISLGIMTGYSVYTADKAWSKLPLNFNIILIR